MKSYYCWEDEAFDCCISCHDDADEGYETLQDDEDIWYCCAAAAYYDKSGPPKNGPEAFSSRFLENLPSHKPHREIISKEKP